MIQKMMFESANAEPAKYTSKIEAPTYKPKNKQPDLLILCDNSKAKALLREIDKADLEENEKLFLRLAAQRHLVFNYERIADYYAHARPEMQRLMERSALVIIDFDSAIEQGFVRLCDEIKTQFLEEYPAENPAPDLCPHRNAIGSCDDCDRDSDFAFDSAREGRLF